MKSPIIITALGSWIALALASTAATYAANDYPMGTIEGRVLNTATGEYLAKARLTVAGTSLEIFSGTSGEFRLSPVPTGELKVTVFYTGTVPLTETIAVAAGATARSGWWRRSRARTRATSSRFSKGLAR
jgi:hypothetical protein